MEETIDGSQRTKKLFWLCWMTYMVSCLGRFNYAAAMAELIDTQGYSKAAAGAVGTAMFVVYGICQLATGWIGDRVSARRMIAFGLFGSAAVNVVMGCVSTQRVMLVLWMLNGVFQACMWAPVARIFAERLPEEQRKRAFSNAAATIPVAMMLIYAMAALSIRYASWRFVFWIPALSMLSAACIWLPQCAALERGMSKHVVQQSAHIAAKAPGLRAMLLPSGMLFIAFASFSLGLLKDGIQAWIPTFLTENFGLTTSVSTAASLLLPLCNIAGVILTRWFIANHIHNELRGAAVCFGIALAGLSMLIWIQTVSGVVSFLLLTVASTAMIGASILLINLVPMRFGIWGRAGTMTGILNCCAYGGSAVSSFGVGAVAQRAGWGAAILFWLGFAAVACAACVGNAARWQRYRDRLVAEI